MTAIIDVARLARLLLPGPDPASWPKTTVYGIVGALLTTWGRILAAAGILQIALLKRCCAACAEAR